MGYDIHITRAENWADNQGSEISAQEWMALVQNDPTLQSTPENGSYFVIWRGSSKYPETWFDWFAGNIDTKNPDRVTLQKMWQMAQKLNAQVQGDDGELYDEHAIANFDDSYLDQDPPSDQMKQNPQKPSLSSIFRGVFRRK